MTFRFSIAAAFAAAVATSAAAQVHGKTDVFSAPGVALAWAVARGPDEAKTFVVIRVAADPAVFHSLSVTGRDPFSNARKEWLRATPLAGRMDVRIPRAALGDFPRTELRFHASPDTAANPKLEVFYLGVPDTTPEFADAGRMEAYLVERIAKLKNP